MKKNKLIFIATLSATCLFSLASCQGAQGPKGDQGEPGINGTNGQDGKPGENGEDGNSVRTGKGVPASTLGKDGDSYIDTETFDFYVKSNGAWSKEGNIKGASGDSGIQGEDGASIRNGKGAPADTLGNDGDCYIDLSTFDFYVKADGKWSKEGNIKGEKGEAGEKGDKGDKGNPGSTGSQGADGATAWSNTILPSTGGYVTVDKGSALANNVDTVTFTAHPDNDKVLSLLTISNNGDYVDSISGGTTAGEQVSLKTTMKKGGFVVQATFLKPDASKSKDTVIDEKTGKPYDDLAKAIAANEEGEFKLLKDSTFQGSTGDIDISSANTTIDLNGHSLESKGKITLSSEVEEFTITGEGVVKNTTLSSDSYLLEVSNQGTSLKVDEKVQLTSKGNGIHVVKGNEEGTGSLLSLLSSDDSNSGESTNITIDGKITASGDYALKVDGKQEGELNVTINNDLISKTNAIDLQGGNLTVNKGLIKGETGLKATFEEGDEDSEINVTLNGGTFETTTKEDDTFTGDAIYVDEGVKVTVDDSVIFNGKKNIPVLTKTFDFDNGKVIVPTGRIGEKIKISIIPDDGYTFSSLKLNDEEIKFDSDKYTIAATDFTNPKKLEFETTLVEGGFKITEGKFIDHFEANTKNIQDILDGKYGSISGMDIKLEDGEYNNLEVGRATKYAGSETDYYAGSIIEDNKKTYAEIINENKNHYYVRNMKNVKLIAKSDKVNVSKLDASAGHHYDNPHDYVLDKNSGFYLAENWNNITFEGINFTGKVDINSSQAETSIDGVNFKSCSFTTDCTPSNTDLTTDAQGNIGPDFVITSYKIGLRFYNEKNTQKIKNLSVDDCTFKDCYQAIYTTYINGVSVTNSKFDGTLHNAIAIQSGATSDYGNITITGNEFSNIYDRIIRFGFVGSNSSITIKNNTLVTEFNNSVKEHCSHETTSMKAQKLEEDIIYDISNNDWGTRTVSNDQLKDEAE